MRNKGFFWFITILLTAICLYQLSFTWVSNSVETKAAREADSLVEDLKKEAAKNNNIALLPNGTQVDFSSPEANELAKAAFVNQILRSKQDKSVYPIFGSTFSQVKTRSLAFGLDLVGGMSVTMEISVPDLVASFAQNQRSLVFVRPFESAKKIFYKQGGDFIEIFTEEYKRINKGQPLVKAFAISEIEGLGKNSSDRDVVSFLKDKLSSSMDGVELIMNRRVNQFGVAQPNIQKDPANNRLYIELPGVQDEATVGAKLKSTANLQFYETYFGSEISANWQTASQISMTPEKTEEEMLAEETTDSTQVDSTKTEVTSLEELTKGTTAKGATKGLTQLVKNQGGFSIGTVSAEDKLDVVKILNRKDVMSAFPEDLAFMWSADLEDIGNNQKAYNLYAVKIPETGRAMVGGSDIKAASTGFDQTTALITVDLEMNEEGSEKWAEMTSNNKDRIIAITMDSLVYSAPRVNEPISGGRTQISGGFTIEEAKDLAGLLNGGALPAPCIIKEQTKVGPTIGAENAKSGLVSFGFAILLVLLYMYLYYGRAGMVANIALMANILFILGSLASFSAVLTLAGIAGLVLTIGMAVDANVLIFERIREELAAGKDMAGAIDEGFKKALSSIIDANVTTLLTAFVLKIFGSGPIESFATTLIIGLFTSVFAALVVTRLILLYMMKKGYTIGFDNKFSKNAFKNINFDFVGKRKVFYAISLGMIAIGLVSLFTKGFSSSVEFSGGRTYGVKFQKSAKDQIEYIRTNLSKVFVEGGKSSSIDIKTKQSNFYVEITTNYMLNDAMATEKVKAKLEEGLNTCKAKVGEYEIQESRTVSPTISAELKQSSTISIVISLVIIFAYILLRFGSWQYSVGAILAMIHDVLLVLASFSLFSGILPFSLDLDQAFIAAILTVIGYSINDTVIVYDRIREVLNFKKDKVSHAEMINSAVNSTLSRTINTSMTTFITLLVIFIFGGAAIKGFVFALMVGVLVGTYSSICIATPVLIDLSKKIKA